MYTYKYIYVFLYFLFKKSPFLDLNLVLKSGYSTKATKSKYVLGRVQVVYSSD